MTDADASTQAKGQLNPLRGLTFMLMAAFFIQVMNVTAKFSSEALNPIEIVFYRGLFCLACLFGWLLATRRFELLKTDRLSFHISRGVIGNISVCTVFWAYSLMPMTECTALIQTSGLITALLSLLFLKEKVGFERWFVVGVGFIGTLLVIQPHGENFNVLGTSACLIAAMTTGTVAVMLRSLGKTEHLFTTVFYFMLSGVILTGLYVIASGAASPEMVLLPLLGTSLAGLLQQLFKTEAYRYAEASFLSPFLYTVLIWAVLFGWLFWDEVPNFSVLCGAGLIASCNLAMAWLGQRKKRKSSTREPDQQTEYNTQ